MTNEETKMFLDNLKICIDEHPVVADWLVEIADRKTEPTSSKMEQVEDEPQTETKGVGYCNECKWFRNKQVCGRCRSKNLFAEADTPQTDCAWK